MDSSDPRFEEILEDVTPNIVVTSDPSDNQRVLKVVESLILKGNCIRSISI